MRHGGGCWCGCVAECCSVVEIRGGSVKVVSGWVELQQQLASRVNRR